MENKLHLDFVCPMRKEDFSSVNDTLYCGQCHKTIVDFSDKEKEYIIQELSRYNTMPCVILPESALDAPINTRSPFLRFWRKSSVFLGILLLVTNVKNVFAQAVSKTTDKNTQPAQIPYGFQKIALTGFIHDEEGTSIPDADVGFYFDRERISSCKTDSNGRFTHTIENYGGIREIEIRIAAPLHKLVTLPHIQVLKENHTFDILLPKTESYIVYEDLPSLKLVTMLSGKPRLTKRGKYVLQETPVFVDRLHYPIQIVDDMGMPVPNARVEFHFPKQAYRWGISDQKGNLTFRIELDEKAGEAQLKVKANGYISTSLKEVDLQRTDVRVIQMHKKK